MEPDVIEIIVAGVPSVVEVPANSDQPDVIELLRDRGPAGQSAYELAVAQGFVGTEAAWLQSLEGPAGPQGLTGATGAVGSTGPQGPQGIQGLVGATGDTGPAGPQGVQGPVGPEGPQGLIGLTGPQGPIGLTGPQGIPGNDGATGLQGPSGATAYEVAVSQGFVGTEADWLLTLVGPQGAQGPTGAQGPQGLQGLTGDTGPQGATGLQGPAGNDGAAGPQGIQGIQGPEGPQGPIGLTGPEGPTGSIGALTDVDITGISDGDALVWNQTGGTFETGQVASSGASVAEATAIAAGSTLGLEQQLLAAAGQTGRTVLAVGNTYHEGNAAPSAGHKVQLTSLGEGNVLFVYATGADFNNGVVQEGPVFLGLGEIYVVENVQNGTILTTTQGAYGFSQQKSGNNESPMPLLSLALAFTDTFLFGFRNSNSNEGRVYVVNGPLASEVTLQTGAGVVVLGQANIPLTPWQFLELSLDGNQEYRILATNSIMACVAANQDVPQFYDSRLVLPTTNDGITWPRSGQVSAPFANTAVRYFVNDGIEGTFTVSPGTPVDFDGTTGATDSDYEPRGATRVLAAGLISAFSGADSAGLEASPLCPTSTFTQRLALPLHIRNAGDGGNNGIALASPFEGTARLYEWNQSTNTADLVTVNDPAGSPTTEILLQRRAGVVTVANDQLHPASALLSAQGAGGSDPDSYDLLGDFLGGYIEVDVPCTCVFNSEQNENSQTDHTFRGTSGAAVVGIHSDDDEQLTYGIIPDDIRAEIRRGDDGLLYKRRIGQGGTDSWVLV